MRPHDIGSIDVDRFAFVRITFADGVVATYDLAPLRLACPCADCNAKRQQGRPVSILAESDPSAITIADASMAGAWGLNLDWSDGHSTGIYAFEKLREWIDDGVIDARVERPTGPPDAG